MDEVERAIAYFEDAVRESDEIIADSVLREELTEQREYFVVALTALREQAERGKLMQWLDDMNNPLEPLKIDSALRSEIM